MNDGEQELFYFKIPKLSDRNKYLLTLFAICCGLIAWMAWSLNNGN